MNHWPYEVSPWSMDDILSAVKDDDWQALRLSLKGIPTEEKLDRLEEYMASIDGRSANEAWRMHCRIDNYINALKRGGQLNMQMEVVR